MYYRSKKNSELKNKLTEEEKKVSQLQDEQKELITKVSKELIAITIDQYMSH